MRKRFWAIAFMVIAVLLVYSVANVIANPKNDVPEEKLKIIEGATYNVIDQAHFMHVKFDDEYSRKVFDQYFENLDFEKKYFTEQDFAIFDKNEDKMDDDFEDTNLDFFHLVDSIYLTRLTLTEGWYKAILDKPFDYSREEQVTDKGEDMQYVADTTSLKERWRLLLKERSLAKYAELKKFYTENADSLKKEDALLTDTEIEEDARENTLKIFDRFYKRLETMSLQDRYAIFLNSYLGTIDPHTNYFPPADREDFDITMSGSFFGIGAQLRQEEDHTVVERIIVGSPCYKQGSLAKDDIIEKVAQGDDEPVDITGMFLDDVVKMIRGKKGTEVRLTVKHLDGNKEIIPIIRDKVDLEDTYVKSAIIKDKGKKIGFISLPEFYFDTNDRNGRTCYKDMKSELINLKQEKIDGLIVDLRNNGGGSLSDVVKIVGLFIEEGPVVKVLDREGDSQSLDDRDYKTYYDGPLTILVNEGSASASEIMAAALQDYNRALVLGTTTFGKGTVQQFVDLQRVVPKQTIDAFLTDATEEEKALGSVKLTIQKFYRINGGSTQRKGVIPDVQVPDMYEYIDRGEREIPSALPWDSIAPADFKKIKANGWNTRIISQLKSEIAKSQYFKDMLQVAEYLKKEKDRTYTPLNYTLYVAQKNERDLVFKIMEKYNDDEAGFLEVANPSFRLSSIKKDTASTEKNQNWLKAIARDHYIDLAVKSFQ